MFDIKLPKEFELYGSSHRIYNICADPLIRHQQLINSYMNIYSIYLL